MEIADISLHLQLSLWNCLNFISKRTNLFLKLALTSMLDSTFIYSFPLQLWAPLSLRIFHHVPWPPRPPLASFPTWTTFWTTPPLSFPSPAGPSYWPPWVYVRSALLCNPADLLSGPTEVMWKCIGAALVTPSPFSPTCHNAILSWAFSQDLVLSSESYFSLHSLILSGN